MSRTFSFSWTGSISNYPSKMPRPRSEDEELPFPPRVSQTPGGQTSLNLRENAVFKLTPLLLSNRLLFSMDFRGSDEGR